MERPHSRPQKRALVEASRPVGRVALDALTERVAALEERWKDHPDYVRRGPTEAEWGKAIDESWSWFQEKLGRTPSSYDVQMWIDGYAPRA